LNKDLSNTITNSNILEEIKQENLSKTSATAVFSQNQTKSYLDNTEERQKNIEYVKKEFNQLADLLNVKSESDNTFKIDLFSGKKRTTQGNEIEEEEDFIEIEREKETDTMEKVKGMFDDFDVKPTENDDYDDLLDLMDRASKK
jgi:hypothetical protein